MKTLRHLLFAATMIVALPIPWATAQSIGDTIYASGPYLTQSQATIGPGVEFTGFDAAAYFDFEESRLIVRENPNHTGGAISDWSDYIFSGFDATIIDVAVVENYGYTGGFVDGIEFSEHSITFNLDGHSRKGVQMVLDIQTTLHPDQIVVPSLAINEAMELRWASRNGLNYQVQRSADGQEWNDTGDLVEGDGLDQSVLLPVEFGMQHLRIAVRPSLIGDSINVTGSQITPSQAAIGAGVEFTGFGGVQFFDFESSRLTIRENPDNLVGAHMDWPNYVFSGFDATIVDVSVVENYGFTGNFVNNVSFTEHSITFDNRGHNRSGVLMTLDIQTTTNSSEDSVVSSLETRPAIELRWNSQSGVRYQIQYSADLNTWLNDGPAILGTGSEMSALRAIGSETRYFRLALSPNFGAGAGLESGTLLVASFEAAAVGSISSDGQAGAGDNLPWSVFGGGVVASEFTLPNRPANPGLCLFANDGDIRYRSASIDLRDVPNYNVSVSIDFRTYEDSSGSDWEEEDRIEAWIEGSEDGINFSRLAAEVGTLIPLTTGDASRVTHNPNDPNSDDLERLQLAGGAYTTFSTGNNVPIPPEIDFIRVHLEGSNNSSSERFFVDNVEVHATGTESVPFRYQIQWFPAQSPDEFYYLFDVGSDGTVVGDVDPGADVARRYAMIQFPDGSEINLEELIREAGQLPTGWRVVTARTLSDDLLIGLDVFDGPPATSRLYAGAVKLKPDRSFDAFSYFGDPGDQNALIRDSSEGGDFLVTVGAIRVTDEIYGAASNVVWNPSTGRTTTLPGNAVMSVSNDISDDGIVLRDLSLYHFLDPPPIQAIALPDSSGQIWPHDIGSGGTVVAWMGGPENSLDTVARWAPGSDDWETLVAADRGDFTINGVGEIAGLSNGGLFIFHEDFGVQYINDLLAPSEVPFRGGIFRILENSEPAEGGQVGGVILGKTLGNSFFTLTPVPAEQR